LLPGGRKGRTVAQAKMTSLVPAPGQFAITWATSHDVHARRLLLKSGGEKEISDSRKMSAWNAIRGKTSLLSGWDSANDAIAEVIDLESLTAALHRVGIEPTTQ
jgi:hypothetical protein